MPSILILSYHFYPSPTVGAKRVSELACRLRDEGWQVTVLCAPGKRVTELMERIRDIEIITVERPPKLYPLLAYWPKRFGRGKAASSEEPAAVTFGKGPHAQKSAGRRESPLAWLKRNYHALELTIDDTKLWSVQVLLRALRLGPRFDGIISSGPPHSVHFAARLLAGLTGAQWIMDLRDPVVCTNIWPEQGATASALRDRVERWVERTTVRHARGVTVASPGIGSVLVQRVPAVGGKLQVVLNGHDGRAAPTVWPTGQLRLLYAGSLYLNRNPFPLLEALHDLLNQTTVNRLKVRFRLVGQCERWNGRQLLPWIESMGMGDVVQVLPAVSPIEVAALMRESEVLVNFAQGQPQQIPAKLYDYIASGREMLLIAEADSDAARITRESGAGRIIEPEDHAGLRAAVGELYTFYVARGLAYAPDDDIIDRFSREHQNQRFMNLLAGSVTRGGM